MKDRLARYFGQAVEVRAHGFAYRGDLVGADEEFIYLLGIMGWTVLPLEAVTSVKRQGGGEEERDFKLLPGAEPPTAAEREAKRRYGPRDVAKVHEAGPEGADEKNSDREDEGGTDRQP